jgi:hypothetical protein
MNKRSLKVNSVALANLAEMNRKIGFTVVTVISLLALSWFATKALGQTGANQQPVNAQQGSANKEYLGPSGDSIKSYRPAGRDPFKKVMPPKKPVVGKGGVPAPPKPLGFPALDERRAKFRAMVEDYGDRGLAEPNPVMQYLVSELEITGIFRDDSGYGAFVRAAPTGTTFFIRRGARCYNGEVLRIESDTSNSGSKVTFRQEAFVEVNGKQIKQENIVSKQPTTGAKAQ